MSQNKLEKSLGFTTALSTVVGIVIGSGVFFKANAVLSATGAPGLGILAWALGGIITIAAGLTAAEIAGAIPKTGGMVTYMKEIYGEKIGFLTGWMLSSVYYPGMIAALGVIFATNVVDLLGLSEGMIVVIAIITILSVCFANTLGGKTGGAIQVVSTACKLIPLALIIVVGFIKGEGSISTSLMPITNPELSTASALGAALLAVLFSYEGWLSAGNLAGEMKNPAKDLPKAITIGVMVVMLVYVVINIAYLWVLPAEQLASSATPASDVAKALFGNVGGSFVIVGIIISVFGTLNALILTGPRALFSLAESGKLPLGEKLSKISNKGVPANAIWVTSAIACVYALTGSWAILTDIPIFVCWVFYIMTFAGVIVLRKKQPNLKRSYKVPFYPFIPMVAIIGGIYVVVSTLFNQTTFALIGLLITAIGLPLYYINKKEVEETV